MPTTYKRLSSAFLTRATGDSSYSGYYYGEEDAPTQMPGGLYSYKVDTSFGTASLDNNVGYAVADTDGTIFFTENISGVQYIKKINPGDSASDRTTVVSNAGGPIVLDGDYLLAVTSGSVLRRFSKIDGSEDTSFNTVDANNQYRGMPRLYDGSFILFGDFITVNGITRTYICKISNDGTLDPNFNPSVESRVYGVEIQPDGKILICGAFDEIDGVSRYRIARLNSDGTLDHSFKISVPSEILSSFFSIDAIKLKDDGKILIGGNGWWMMLDESGAYDDSFKVTYTDINAGSANTLGFEILDDGKIFVYGGWSRIVDSLDSGANYTFVPRLHHSALLYPDGTLDENYRTYNMTSGYSEFGTVKGVIVNPSNNDITLFGVALDEDSDDVADGYIFRLNRVISNAPYQPIYTVPLGKSAIVKSIFASNHKDFPVFHDVAVLPNEESNSVISEKHLFLFDDLIDSNDYNLIESSLTLSEGDQIFVYSSTDEDISYNIFGIELDN